MRIISETEFRNIIEKHQLWLEKKDGGERADLSDADLCNVDLSNVNLCGADLRNTYLHGANLSNANLSKANLSAADLCGADLSGSDLHNAILYHAYLSDANLCRTSLYKADLSHADLRNTNLSNANLGNANLFFANLSRANLSDTNFYCANLCNADLYDANLRGADFRSANLYRVNMYRVKNLGDVIWDINTMFYSIQCPESGAFVGYKKASEHIIKLEICEDALRSSATSRKCRCSKAKVLEIQNIDGTPSGLTSVVSNYDHSFFYTVGKIVEVKDFDTDRWKECAPGIHFFLTRDEAVKYC